MPPFKDEHILIISPGSQTTLAQLGLPESFAPAKLRTPTRMFAAEKKGEWEPYKIRTKRVKLENGGGKTATTSGGDSTATQTDAHMSNGEDGTEPKRPNGINTEIKEDDDDEDVEHEEDIHSDEGAVYPLKEGKVENWSCFLALLSHIHNTLSPPFHTPIMLIAQPVWTAQDYETVTQFFFEKFKTPAFCIMDSALTSLYAYGLHTATIVDVGFEKTDVTAINDFVVHEVCRGRAVPRCGGDAMTEKLFELLGPRDWTREMCEQLKKSSVSEILPKDVPIPGEIEPHERNDPANPAAAASTGAVGSGSGQRSTSGAAGEAPRGPGIGTEAGGEGEDQDGNTKEVEDNEGVLDVATIVTSGKTSEYLARKEREKAEKAAAKKGAADAAAAAAAANKATRLPNSKRSKNTFFYETRRSQNEAHGETADEEAPLSANPADPASATQETFAESGQTVPDPAPAPAAPESGDQTTSPIAEEKPTDQAPKESNTDGVAPAVPAGGEADMAKKQERAARKEEKRRIRQGLLSEDPSLDRREIEVGVERFLAASGGLLDTIADVIHRTVLAVEHVGKRGELWENIIIVGNGSRVRGFKDALLATLTQKYLVSPSSATIFTSELPSNMSTPIATGANTPIPAGHAAGLQQSPAAASALGGGGSHVNPLLVAATHASSHPGAPQHQAPPVAGQYHQQPAPYGTPQHYAQQMQIQQQQFAHQHSSHGQSPTSLKLAKIPEYFPEWKEAGYEEAGFLGAQVAAKVVFVVDQGVSKGFMTRVEYNDLGPSGIHECSL